MGEFWGRLFNGPQGKDVYKGCKVDYRGSIVTADLFRKVLTGDADGVKQIVGRSSGYPVKVLNSTADDDVFVFFVDHGVPGLLVFPNGPSLHSTELLATL